MNNSTLSPKQYFRTLTIAGSDPSGGAGIQADLKTFAALNCYGLSAITALTVQNTQGVFGIQITPPEIIKMQIQKIIADIDVDAIKLGMLFNSETIKVVANELNSLNHIPIVIDPVMVSSSGDILLENNAIVDLQKILFPLSTLITPNIIEAQILLDTTIENQHDMTLAAQAIASYSKNLPAVLIKGGHLKNADSLDCLYVKATNEIHWFKNQRIDTNNTHGTGCTLSSAITAYLARGYDLVTAITQAKKYISQAISHGSQYQLGHGHGPVHHFYQYWT